MAERASLEIEVPDSPNIGPISPTDAAQALNLHLMQVSTSAISLLSLSPDQKESHAADDGSLTLSPLNIVHSRYPSRRPSLIRVRLPSVSSLYTPDSPHLSPVSLNSSPSKLNLGGSTCRSS